MKSIIQNDLTMCIVCGKRPAEIHHIFFGTANRKLSDKYGMIVGLCEAHHRGTRGVHGRDGKGLNEALKESAQKAFEKQSGTRDDFIMVFGKSYL